MSADKAIVSDEHKFPFSLVSDFKHGHNREITKVGDVSELMDKAIGRLVFRIKGSVSANNYIEFDTLSLVGPILYIQMCLAKPSIATIHLEVLTTTNIPLRLTLSTLYNGDSPRFLGRSLRLPLPVVPGWMILAVDLDQILAEYCTSPTPGARSAVPQLQTLKKIQLCSNMLVRDVVTSDKPIPSDPKYLPKELAVKPLPPSQALHFVDLVQFCASIPANPAGSPEALAGLKFSPGEKTPATKTATPGLASASRSSLSATENGKAIVEANGPNTKSPRVLAAAAAAKKAVLESTNASLPAPPTKVAVVKAPPPPALLSPVSPVFINSTAQPLAEDQYTVSPRAYTTFRVNVADPAPAAAAEAGSATPITFTAASAAPSLPLGFPAKKGPASPTAKTAMATKKFSIVQKAAAPVPVKHSQESLPAPTAAPQTTLATDVSAMFDEESVDAAVSGADMITADASVLQAAGPTALPGNGHAKHAPTAAVKVTKPSVAAASKPRTTGTTSTSAHSGNVATAGTVLSKALSTHRHIPLQIPGTAQTGASAAGATPSSALSGAGFSTVKYSIPETQPGDRVLQLERLLGYSGGPAVLLYEGRMLLLATGSLLVMIDIDTDGAPVPKYGLFRAFRSTTSLETSPALLERDLGFKQSFLRGHSNPVGLIEVSEKDALMVTGETSTAGGQLILWDLREGKRLATLRPHAELLQCAAFSTDGAMLVTVGTDAQARQQIIVWDIAQLVVEKATNIAGKTTAIVAKQISEFPVHKIRFSPFEEFGLVSCGRENIRFWRIRKGHLPGRPVLLNEYARGYSFLDIGFHSDAGATPRDPRRPAVYVASNKGLLLRISCQTDQIMCAYQLHPCAIRTLAIHSGYAVTGAEDNKLRLWPLDFTDFLLEAQHEGVVSNIRIALDGRKLAIGTTVGTVGVLNVSEHSYNTVLRSHSAAVTQAVPCTFGPHRGEEFATVGRDNTVRIWSATSGNQVIEFTSEKDQPTCCVYHPASETYIACGYSSGYLRIFDVTTATAVLETRAHSAAVVGVRYFQPKPEYSAVHSGILAAATVTLLATSSLDGTVLIHDASEDGRYLPIKKISFGGPIDSIHLEVSEDSSYLAVASSKVGSLTVFETKDFTAQLRLASSSTAANSSASPLPGSSADFPTATMQSITYNSESTVHPAPVAPIAAVPATPAPATPAPGAPTSSGPQSATSALTVSPDRKSTISSAANANSSAAAANGAATALHAPLVGLTFVKDSWGWEVLLATDKHLISVCLGHTGTSSSPIPPAGRTLSASKRIFSPWDERLTKRLDCGIPTFMTRDTASGLIYLGLRAPLMTNKLSAAASNLDSGTGGTTFRSLAASAAADIASAGTGAAAATRRASTTSTAPTISASTKLSDVANAFAVLNVKLRASLGNPDRRDKLSVSTPQVYQDLPGEVQGVCPCVGGNKVVTVDAGGAVVLWHLRSSNLSKVRVNITAPSPSDALLGLQSREYRNADAGSSRYAAAAMVSDFDATTKGAEPAILPECNTKTLTQTASTAVATAVAPAVVAAPVQPTASTTAASTAASKAAAPSTPKAQALTRDFERAVLHDPSIWSANSAATPSSANQAAHRDQAAEDAMAALFDYAARDNAPQGTKPSGTASSVSKTRMSDKKPSRDATLELNTSTASYDIMFPDDGVIGASETTGADSLNVSASTLGSNRASLKVSDLNTSGSSQTRRIGSTGGNTTSVSASKHPSSGSSPAPAAPLVASGPIDNPLAGLSVWKDLQSPTSAGKKSSKAKHAPTSGAVPMTQFFNSDSEEDEPNEEGTRQMDSLELLQRARSNMHASRVGTAGTTATGKTGTSTTRAASTLPKSFFMHPEGDEQVHVSATNHSNTVAPQFCQGKCMMVTCDGGAIMVKYVSSGEQVALGFPERLMQQRGRCTITSMRLHASGSMIAALVRCTPKNAYYLVVWVLAGYDENEGVPFDPVNVEWRCMDCAFLGTVESAADATVSLAGGVKSVVHTDAASRGQVCLEWTPTGSLLVLKAQSAPASAASTGALQLSTNGLLLLALVSPEVIYSGNLSVNWSDMTQVIESPLGHILSITALPGVVVDYPQADWHTQVPTVHVVIVGESRCMMVALSAHKNPIPGQPQADLARVVWSDDLGARGPILAVEASRCAPSSISSSAASAAASSAPFSHTGKTTAASRRGSGATPAASAVSAADRARDETDALVAVLDSCGTIKFTVFAFYAQEGRSDDIWRYSTPSARSVTTKVPAANASGGLRTMSLFPPQNPRAPHFLAIAAAQDVRLFTLSLRELNAKSITVSLTVLYRIALESPPDYLLTLRPIAYGTPASAVSKKTVAQMGPAGYAPHVLVSNHQGYIGFIPNARWVNGRHLPSSCMTLQSAPLQCPAGSSLRCLVRPDVFGPEAGDSSELLVALCRGHLQLYHGVSGIKLPFGGFNGITHATCVVSTSALILVGSRCGRVAVFDAATMQQQELISVASAGGQAGALSSLQTSGGAAPKESSKAGRPHTVGGSSGAGAVSSLRALPGGGCVLVALESGDLHVVRLGATNKSTQSNQLASIFTPSVVTPLPAPLYQTAGVDQVRLSVERMYNPHQHCAVLATCAGEDRLCGVIRKHSNILELYFRDRNDALVNYLNVSLKTPVDLESNTEGVNSAYFPSSQPAQFDNGANIAATACHVIVTDRTYVISIVGRLTPHASVHPLSAAQAANAPVYLFSGSVTLPDVPAGTVQAVLNYKRSGAAMEATPYLATLKQRVLLDDSPATTSTTASQSSGSSSSAALQVQSSVFFSGRHCAVVTAENVFVVDLFKVYTGPVGADIHNLCAAIIPAHITQVGSAHSAAGWADSTALLCVEETDAAPATSAAGDASGYVQRDLVLQASTLSLVVYRRHKSAMLRFRISCL